MAKNTPAFTEQQVAEALTKSEGFVYVAASKLKCHGKTVEKYIRRFPALQALVHQFKEKHVDDVEAVLISKARAGEAWAVIFFLKTRGRQRGYTERYEFSHEFKDKSDADLLAFIQERTGEVGGVHHRSGTAGAEDPAGTLH